MTDAVIGSLVFEMRANAARLNTDLGKVTSDFRKLEREVKGIGRNIGHIFNAAFTIVGVKAIQSMAGALTELAKRGEIAGSIAESFERLGGSAEAISAAKNETLGMVSSFDLMKIASEGLLKNVPDLNENFSLMARYGAQLADTLGGDTKQKIEEVTEAIAKASEKSLFNIGIVIDTDKAYENFAKRLGITKEASQRWQDVLTDQQQKLARQAEGLTKVKQRSEELAPVTMSVANAQEAFNTAISDAKDKFGISINASNELAGAYNTLAKIVNDLDWQKIGQDAAEFANVLVGIVNNVLPPLISGTQTLAKGLSVLFNVKTAENLAQKWVNAKNALAAARAEAEKPIKVTTNNFGMPDLFGVTEEEANRLIQSRIDKVKELEKETADAYEEYQRLFITPEIPGFNKPKIATIEKDAVKAANAERARGLSDYDKQWQALEKAAAQTRNDKLKESADLFNQSILDGINGDWSSALSKLALSFSQELGEEAAGTLSGIGAGIGTAISAALTKNIKGTNSQGGGIFGSLIGAAIGSAGGPGGSLIGAQIGSQLGTIIGKAWKTGLQNAESKARVDVEQWLEGVLKNTNARFFDANGKLGSIFSGNILGKSLTGVFNTPGWASAMDAWGDEAKGVFLGLGEALKEVRGISEDVGSQIAYILGENLAGNIDNARLLVQELGLSFEELSDALLSSAMKGKISWLEFNSYIRDTAEAFESGRSMFADVSGAFQSLIDSAGQGRVAIKGFRDTAIEAMEDGATTVQQLRDKLLAKGFDPQIIDAAIQAAAQRGVTTLEGWANATDATAGAIVGDMEALSGNLRGTWEEMRKSLESLTEQLNAIPKQVTSEINLKVKTQYDNATRDVMENLGAAMPGGIMPEGEFNLKQQSGTLGGGFKLSSGLKPMALSGGYKFKGGSGAVKGIANNNNFIAPSINVDARGAAPGVESAIRRAMVDVEARLMNSIASSIASARARGGRAADSY